MQSKTSWHCLFNSKMKKINENKPEVSLVYDSQFLCAEVRVIVSYFVSISLIFFLFLTIYFLASHSHPALVLVITLNRERESKGARMRQKKRPHDLPYVQKSVKSRTKLLVSYQITVIKFLSIFFTSYIYHYVYKAVSLFYCKRRYNFKKRCLRHHLFYRYFFTQ